MWVMSSKTIFWVLSWVVAIAILVFVCSYTIKLSDITDFVAITETAKPVWILGIIIAQLGTYVNVAWMYRIMLKVAGHDISIIKLLPLSVEKLAIDQFIPTAGLGGSALVVQGLRRNGASSHVAVAMVIIGVAAWYLAGDIAGIIGLWTVRDFPVIFSGGLIVVLLYTAISVVIISITLKAVRMKWFTKLRQLIPIKPVQHFLDELIETRKAGILTKKLFGKVLALQITLILLDAATLAFACAALGSPIPFHFAIAGYILANIAATLSILPGGLGVFEGGSVAILSLLGLSPATALAATVLYRGFSLWLPLIPGALFARHEIHQAHTRELNGE